MRILAFILLLAFVANVPGKPVRQPPVEPKSDQELVQGDWIPVAFKLDDKNDMRKETLAGTIFTFKGNDFLIVWPNPNVQQNGLTERAIFKIDPTKKPRQIDFQFNPIVNAAVPPGNPPLLILGIYEFDGANLRICMGPPGAPRPAEFSPKGKIVTLRRKTP